ncbi:MAG: hypothetical protein AB7I48_15030 [Planctomycetaceae bacterium]
MQAFFFVTAVMGTVLLSGHSLGELSLAGIALILAAWLLLLGLTLAMGWPAAVMIVVSVVISIGLILKVFGGDLRIR